MEYVSICANRDCYSPKEAMGRSMTVGELIDFLGMFDEDAKVVLSHDGGYTYGWLTMGRIGEDYTEEDDE